MTYLLVWKYRKPNKTCVPRVWHFYFFCFFSSKNNKLVLQHYLLCVFKFRRHPCSIETLRYCWPKSIILMSTIFGIFGGDIVVVADVAVVVIHFVDGSTTQLFFAMTDLGWDGDYFLTRSPSSCRWWIFYLWIWYKKEDVPGHGFGVVRAPGQWKWQTLKLL